MKRVKLNGSRNLLSKAVMSAGVGIPISYLLNIGLLPPLSELIISNVFIASAVLCLVFFLASIARMYIIDYMFQKYHINLDPVYQVKRLIKSK